MAGKGKGKAKSKSDRVGAKSPDSSGQDRRHEPWPKNTTKASDQVENRPSRGNQTAEIMLLDKITGNQSIKQTLITVWADRVDNGQAVQIVVDISGGVHVYIDGKLFAER